MSQRGGDVQSNLRISSKEIASDLIPMGKADLILSVEPMESLRYLPYLSKNGYLVTNTKAFNNISDYPDEEELITKVKSLAHHVAIDADKVASEIGSPRSMNIVILGAASPFIDIPFESFVNGIRKIFAKKGENIINLNLQALKAGREFAEREVLK
jgi:indolepyruvate ferredoxin oxidoreductase beta subunit